MIKSLSQREIENTVAKKLSGIRSFLTDNQDVYETLKDTPLGPGGEYDIFSTEDNVFNAMGGASTQSMNSIYHSQFHNENFTLQRNQEAEMHARQLQVNLLINMRLTIVSSNVII